MVKNNLNNENIKSNYIFPNIDEQVPCPLCQESNLNINRTIHKLPDGEEILILLMQCNKCTYKNRDIIILNSSFKPGKWSLYIDDGDLTPKIFRGPYGIISIPELDITLEPSTITNYMITNIEGLINRLIKYSKFLLEQLLIENKENNLINNEKINKTKNIIQMLQECLQGKIKFHVILEDNFGGSYISVPLNKSKNLKFEELKNP